ncbi:MAG TPA: hypothetical protein VKY85_11555 [Candidatus Angelobacter sp.]|nr:hypothetical protein [Candidatus Angelobacter sp.]
MRKRVLRALCAIAVATILLLPSLCSALTHNILLIHGRADSTHEQFGVFATDQLGYWSGRPTTVDGHVYFVQWDAWNRKFDDTTCPGGQCIINNAINQLCNIGNNQECWIICHSAGCAAFENYLAKSNYCCNPIFIAHVMAASSAAGGSELADVSQFLPFFGHTIDSSLTTGYARGAYNHNNMQGVVVRSIGGTKNNTASACLFFPSQIGSGLNPDCNICPVGRFTFSRQCSDGVVALHSTCGHNRVASFQDCNSTLFPHNDTAGTYSFHGWWVADQECNGQGGTSCNWSGPYSPNTGWNPGFKTYRVDHGGGANNAVAEYSFAPFALCP